MLVFIKENENNQNCFIVCLRRLTVVQAQLSLDKFSHDYLTANSRGRSLPAFISRDSICSMLKSK